MTDLERRARWDERFGKDAYFFGTEPNAFLVTQRHRLRPGMSVLAVADGEGRNGVWLAEQGVKVLSLDFSPLALEKARKLASARGVRLETEEADLFAWDWARRSFDAVVAIFIQFATPDERTRLFAEMKRALKPGGLLILHGYRPEQIQYGTGGPPQAEHMYTAALLREMFADMTILHLAEYDAVVVEGEGHAGMSALIDMVAQK